MGLGLTEALSIFRRCGGELFIEPLEPQGALVKMIIKKEQMARQAESSVIATEPSSVTDVANKAIAQSDEIDLDDVLSLDDMEVENIFTPQKMNLKTHNEVTKKPLESPRFALSKKVYLVDEIPVKVRRPEK